ncbi:hypothetical protein [Sanguibacter sp. 26GB23]
MVRETVASVAMRLRDALHACPADGIDVSAVAERIDERASAALDTVS